MGEIPNWECLFVHREKGLFLSVYVDDITLAGKKQNLDPMWKVLNKEVDLRVPTSFLDHVCLGCTQRKCEISKDIVDNYRTMFESRISVGRSEKLPCPQNLRISSRSCAGTHVYNPHLLDIRSTSSNVRKAGALVPSPPCLGEGPHGWVPVDTHSTPVRTSVRRLWGGLCIV